MCRWEICTFKKCREVNVAGCAVGGVAARSMVTNAGWTMGYDWETDTEV